MNFIFEWQNNILQTSFLLYRQKDIYKIKEKKERKKERERERKKERKKEKK